MDRDEYRQTAATQPMQVEERETPKFHDFGMFVLSPSLRGYWFGGSVGLGLAMALAALATTSIFLLAIGLFFAFAGGIGMMTMREQLREFNQTPAHWSRKETPIVMPQPDERDYARFTDRKGNTDYVPKQRRDVAVSMQSGDDFIFTGRNVDKLYQWLREHGTALRKVGNDLGPGFNQLPDPIHAEHYTNATNALLNNELIAGRGSGYSWTNKGMQWLEKAGI